MKSKNYKAHISTLIVFLFAGIISHFFVPTHDDLIISTCHSLSKAFTGSLYYGNGRLFGNMMVRMFLNNTVMDTVLRGLCIGGMILLSAILVKGYHAKTICISGVLYLGIGFPIAKQALVWGHGFYNYVPPVFLLLVALCLLKRYAQIENSPWKPVVIAAIFLITLSAQLFAENSSTVNVLIMIVVLLWAILQKKPKAAAVAAVLGSCIGAVLMFLGPTLLGVGDKLKDYRAVETSISGLLRNAVVNAREIVTTLSTAWGLWLVLSVAVLLLAREGKKHIHWIWKTALIGFLPFSLLQNIATRNMIVLAVDGMFAVYLLCVAVILFKLLPKKTRNTVLILLGITAASVAQLFIIHPIGPRCLVITFALLAVCVLYLLPDMEGEQSRRNTLLCGGFAVLGCVAYAVLLTLHLQAWNVHTARMAYAQEQLAEGKTHIEIIRLPHTEMFQYPDDSYVYPYRFHNGNQNEMTFSFISYDEYCHKIK